MSKLRNGLVAGFLAATGLLSGCGDEITYGADAGQGPTGPAGPMGEPGAPGEQGPPGAPATTNDHHQFRPVGQLQGVIYDAYDRRPISGARITINYNGMATTVTTDATGTYSFNNLPANVGSLAGGPGTVAPGGTCGPTGPCYVGAYGVILDLSQTGDADHVYRSYQERRAQVVFADLSDGTSAGGSDQNTNTQVDGLVANLDFAVRQLRGGATGVIYDAEDRTPLANLGLVVTYSNANADVLGSPCPALNPGEAGSVAANATTDAMGAFSITGVEEGVCYNLRPVDDRYVFQAPGGAGGLTYQGGVPFYAPENGVIRRLADILAQFNVGRDIVAPYVVSVTPGDEDVLLAGSDLAQNIVVTFSEPMDTTFQEQLAARLYWGLNASGQRDFPCRGVQANPGSSVSGEWTLEGGVTSGVGMGTGKCRTLDEIMVINSWNADGTVLTIDPQVDFVPGLAYAYRLDLINALLRDLSGNPRTGALPPSLPNANAGDAFRRGGGYTGTGLCAAAMPPCTAPDSIVFTVQAGAALLTVANVTQDLDTADNQAPPTATRASIIEARPDATERSFRSRATSTGGNGMYTDPDGAGPATDNMSNQVYIYWDDVPGAVAYVIYFRSPLYPNPQPLQAIGGTAPPRTAFNFPIAGINAILGMVYVDNPNTPGINEGFINLNGTWDNNLRFEIGVSAINLDGQEGPISFIEVRDNTTPEIRQSAGGGAGFGLGADWRFASAGAPAAMQVGDAIELNSAQWAGCAGVTTTAARMSCLATPVGGYHDLLATSYGQGTVILELSEPIAPASVTTGNLSYVQGFVRTDIGNTTDLNAGEADPTIVGVAPVAVSDGKTRFLAVTLSNIFAADSGDYIQLTGATGSITDLAGNPATAARSSSGLPEAPSFRFVDNIGPMIRAVTVNGTANTVAIDFTKRIFAEDADTGATSGNYTRGNVSFDDATGGTPFFPSLALATAGPGAAGQPTTVYSANLDAEQDTVTYTFADVSWANQDGQVELVAVQNVDQFGPRIGAGTAHRAVSPADRGTMAYVNVRVEQGGTPAGAYSPNAAGIGTRDTWQDVIGPRLSLVDADRNLAAAGNELELACPAAGTTQGAIVIPVRLTDMILNDGSTNAANTPGNWTAVIRDFGGCAGGGPACANVGWNGTVAGAGNAGLSPEAATVAVTAVACAANPAGGATCNVTVTITNSQTAGGGDCAAAPGATSREFAVDSISFAATVPDDQGNTTTDAAQRRYTYSSERNSSAQVLNDNNPANDGWIRL